MHWKLPGIVVAIVLVLLFSFQKDVCAQGRISGLKISNASVVGTTLSFDVTMSTDSNAGLPGIGFLGNHYHSSSDTYTMSSQTTTSQHFYPHSYQCNTTIWTTHDTCTGVSPTSSTYPCNTNTFTDFSTCTTTTTMTLTYTYFYFHTTNKLQGKDLLNPSLPAIDWGDGNTLGQTTLPQVSSGPTRVYRRSFSHSYASTGAYNVRVGAYSGRINSTLPGGGNILTVNTPDSFKYKSYSSTIYKSSGNPVSTLTHSSTHTIASPDHLAIGVTTTTSLGVPVKLQSFTIADASSSVGPIHQTSPMESIGMGLALVALGLGFVLSRENRQ